MSCNWNGARRRKLFVLIRLVPFLLRTSTIAICGHATHACKCCALLARRRGSTFNLYINRPPVASPPTPPSQAITYHQHHAIQSHHCTRGVSHSCRPCCY